MKGQIILLIILFIFIINIIIYPLSEKIDVVHSWEESVEKPHLSISPTSLLSPPHPAPANGLEINKPPGGGLMEDSR